MEEQGYIVLNPAALPYGLDNADCMRISFATMDTAGLVAFLPDYGRSRGARLEWEWWQYVGKQTMYPGQMSYYRPWPD